MKKMLLIALSVICLSLTACERQTSSPQVTGDQSVYDRVNKTGKIRCGYAAWAPALMIDPNTKQITGIVHDLMEEVGKRLNLKIDWAEEVGWSGVVEAVKNKRVDMTCSNFWANSVRARQVEFSTALYYSTINVWVRSDETRFTQPSNLDNENISFGIIEGGAETKAVQTNFPKAKIYPLPELNTAADELEGLKAKKYDAVAIDNASMNSYLQKNPGVFKKLFAEHPINVFPEVLLIPPGETKLKAMIDNTLNEIRYDGTLVKIIEKYNALENVKLPAKPYQE